MNFLDQYLKNISQPIASRIDTLLLKSVELEERASDHNRRNSRSFHLRIKFPTRSTRDFAILNLVAPFLPIQIRMEIISWKERYLKLPVQERRIVLKLQDRIFLSQDTNYLNGRVNERLLWLLNRVQINLVENGRKPKSGERIRGYRDHGVLPDPLLKAFQEANRVSTVKKEATKEIMVRRQEQLEIASSLLARERSGETMQHNVEESQRERNKNYDSRTSIFKDYSGTKLLALQKVNNSKVLKNQETDPFSTSTLFH